MSDYTYNPTESITDYANNQNVTIPTEGSTTLKELDKIDRHSDELNKIMSIDNPYPDILKKPLYTTTVPERLQTVTPQHTTNNRTEILSNEANLYNKRDKKNKSIGDVSLKDFAGKIASSLMDILNDILKYKYGQQDDFITIFTKEDRLLSIGVLFVIISVFFIFFKNTE